MSRSAQPDLDLHCPLTKSLDITECINGEQRSRRIFAQAQDDMNLRMVEGILSLDAVQVSSRWNRYLTHCSLEAPKGVIGKQSRHRSDAAERGV